MNKNLLALSVAAAALASSASAAVSSNIVGYVKTNLKKGLTLISNPLNNTSAAGNKLSNLFGTSLGDAFVYIFDGTTFVTYSSVDGVGFVGDDVVVPPGVSFFVEVDHDTTTTFVGDALLTQSTLIPIGNNFVASAIPTAGPITQLGLVPNDGDVVFKWDGTGYVSYDYVVLDPGQPGSFPNGEPTVDVGQGVIVQATKATTWNRTFVPTP